MRRAVPAVAAIPAACGARVSQAAGVADPTRYVASGAASTRLGYDAPAPIGQRSGSKAQLIGLCTSGFGGRVMKKTLGSYLIELLEAQGVQHVFGIPGVHNLELYRGLASSRIRHVTGRHEQGLGFHGRRLRACLGPARRVLHDHGAGAHQHRHRAGAGLCGFDTAAGDLPARTAPARLARAAAFCTRCPSSSGSAARVTALEPAPGAR